MAKHIRHNADANAGNQLKSEESHNQGPVLKGTFASVMLLGLFLALTWVGVFVLFMVRG